MKSINTAIELGTTKLTVLISRPIKDGNLEVLGLANISYSGTLEENRRYPELLRDILEQALGQAEKTAGYKIKRASLGIPNEFCGLIRNYKEIYPERNITRRDIRRLRKLTEDYTVPDPWEITDVYYGSFNVDGLSIVHPYGIYSETFGLESSLICMDNTFVKSMIKQIESLSIAVNQVIPESAALGNAIVSQDEMDSGALLIDIGGHSTDIAYFESGRPLVLGWLPVGGKHISQDVQMGMDITIDEADKLKRRCIIGQAHTQQKESDSTELSHKPTYDIDDSIHNTDFLKQIIEARVEEMLQMAKAKAASSGLLKDGCNAILTGGGIAMLKGIKNFATEVLQMPVRLGVPDIIGLGSPVYASVYSTALSSKPMHIEGFNLVDYVKNNFNFITK